MARLLPSRFQCHAHGEAGQHRAHQPALHQQPERPAGQEAGDAARHHRNRPVDAVIDVRSKVEFWLGHLDGAKNVPVDRLPDGLADLNLSPKSRILVYCASGMRSAQAASILKAAGYANVVDGGGMSAASQEYAAA